MTASIEVFDLFTSIV